MQPVKISSKNQIVVPALVRHKLNLKHGTSVIIYPMDANHAILSKQPKAGSYAESMLGLGKEIWEELGGVDKYIEGERKSWDEK